MATLTPDIAAARRLVVKIGSALLVDPAGGLRRGWLEGLAADVAQAKARGADVILVSSGSIALGRRVLGLPAGALTLDQSQAAAAVGQIRLARAYEEALAPHGVKTAQLRLNVGTQRATVVGLELAQLFNLVLQSLTFFTQDAQFFCTLQLSFLDQALGLGTLAGAGCA